MAVGKMRHRIELQSRTDTRDAGGGTAVAWSTVEEVWGEVVPLTGTDRIHAMGLQFPVTHRIKIRYRSDVTPKWRAVYDGRTFNIHAVVDEDERKHMLTLSAEEGVVT